jgi:hypothetical protein
MKTFLTYLILFVGFYIVSVILENGLLYIMYANITGTAEQTLITADQNSSDITVIIEEAKASNVSGHIKIKIKNTSGHYIEKCCAKVELFTKRNILATTKYIDVNNFKAQETRTYEIKFKADEIASYAVTLQENAPDTSNIINVLGWEIDLSDVFGVDLSRLKEMVNLDGLKSGATSVMQFGVNLATSVPWWGYLVAGGIVLWYMPVRFLFGLFPF